jgi:hypothetical protein
MKNFIDVIRTTRRLTPVLVCGAARSGTRMATDLLNLHQNVAIQNEMHGETFSAFLELVKTVDTTFAKHSERKGKTLGKAWRKSRAELAHVFLATAGKRPPIGQGKEILYHGIKTPGYERFFRDFQALFPDSEAYVVYCLRAVDKVWRSWCSLGYVDDVELFRMRYERSLRHAIAIKKRIGERFVLFDLDDFAAAEDQADWVMKRLYAPLGLPPSEEHISRIAETPNRNALLRTGKEAVEGEKIEAEMAMLRSNERIREHRVTLGASPEPVRRRT